MSKEGRFMFSIVLVSLLSSTVFAAIGQSEGYLIGAGNSVFLLTDGLGATTNTNTVEVGNNQESHNGSGTVTALQGQSASLIQGASAIGSGGLFQATQLGTALGLQAQLAGTTAGIGVQEQNLTAGLGQDLVRVGGIGSVLAIQSFLGFQVQFIISQSGMSANVQYAGVTQYGGTGGGPDSGGAVSGSANLGVGQGSI